MSGLNDVTGTIVDAAYRIHSRLGPGLFESVYEAVLARDLAGRGLVVERQKTIPLEFEGLSFDKAFRADLIVEQAVIIEVKSLPAITAAHEKQILTYLRLLDCRMGLLLNFGGTIPPE